VGVYIWSVMGQYIWIGVCLCIWDMIHEQQLLKRSIVGVYMWSVMGQYIWISVCLCVWDMIHEQQLLRGLL